MQHPHPAHRPRPHRARRAVLVLAALSLLWLLSLPSAAKPQAGASAEGAPDDGEMRVRGTLVASWQADGEAKLGVLFEPDPGWHLYWRNAGDLGLAPRFDWQLEHAEVGPMGWPLPERFFDAELDAVSYGYEGEVLLAVPVSWDPALGTPESARVAVDVLVCEHLCIPGELELAIPFPRQPTAETAALFSRWNTQIPRTADDAEFAVALSGAAEPLDPTRMRLRMDVTACGAGASCPWTLAAGDAGFYPHPDPALDVVAATVSEGPGPGRFQLSIDAERLDGRAAGGTLTGVLVLSEAGARRGVEIRLPWQAGAPAPPQLGETTGAQPAPVPAEPSPSSGAAEGTGMGLLRAALLAFLGGLLLNLMPCVLPVLALKVFALTELASRSRREVAWQVAAYTGGILLTMMLLAGAVIGLRAAGSAVGWGFHLQEPIFVVTVCALLVAFALNLFGVFEINVDTARLAGIGAGAVDGRRSFFDGLLAVVLATPCSAPFLGTAVGFAFASSGFVIATIFLSIGLGLAAPFALLAAVPAWGRLMPRSGPWMMHLRAGLGFALLASAVWLLWVLGRAAGSDAMAAALAMLVAVALAAWAFGLLQRVGRPLPFPALVGVAAVVLVGGIDRVDFSRPGDDASNPPPAIAQARPWSEAGVQAVLAEGRPAFVYFTADWCITCKLNESRVLGDPMVAETFRALGIPVFRGDWTRRDETIRQALARLGKAGVPAYALYQPRDPDHPAVLPELLSVSGLVSSLEQASAIASGGIRPANITPTPGDTDTRS